ncbi:MAG TPA: septum formation initiator family protein [Longimicrobiaceae bacterium]|nr:septum formation initiator family protein [Longimicrobiaceae bacterium]
MAVNRLGRRALGGLLLGVAAYYAIWGGEYSAFDLLKLRSMGDREDARLAETRAAVDSLRLVAEKMANDSASIERFARERFGMIRDGEVLYRFVAVDTAKTP